MPLSKQWITDKKMYNFPWWKSQIKVTLFHKTFKVLSKMKKEEILYKTTKLYKCFKEYAFLQIPLLMKAVPQITVIHLGQQLTI